MAMLVITRGYMFRSFPSYKAPHFFRGLTWQPGDPGSKISWESVGASVGVSAWPFCLWRCNSSFFAWSWWRICHRRPGPKKCWVNGHWWSEIEDGFETTTYNTWLVVWNIWIIDWNMNGLYIFPLILGIIYNPKWLIFFRGVGQPPTHTVTGGAPRRHVVLFDEIYLPWSSCGFIANGHPIPCQTEWLYKFPMTNHENNIK